MSFFRGGFKHQKPGRRALGPCPFNHPTDMAPRSIPRKLGLRIMQESEYSLVIIYICKYIYVYAYIYMYMYIYMYVNHCRS